jgi:hypothetical protein
MVDFQLPLPGLARDINSLTQQEKEFINYFAAIDPTCINPVVRHYVGVGPRGYGTALIFARILKIREDRKSVV